MRNFLFLLFTSFLVVSCNQADRRVKETSDFKAADNGSHLVLTSKLRNTPLLNYRYAEECPADSLPRYYCRSGYIHPLSSPSGVPLTDAFPVGHTHQHALFFAWTRTSFRGDTIDFWNQQAGLGTVRHKEVLDSSQGPAHAGFRSKLEHVSHKHGVILEEEWEVEASTTGQYNVVDIYSKQTNITDDTLFLLNYHYGGLGVRGHRSWNEVDTAYFHSPVEFLTSEGKDRIAGNHTKPVWTAMFGNIGESVHGLAVLDHPGNRFHPQSIRIHPSMPYFCQAPVVERGFFIAPGRTLDSRYRILTYDGRPRPDSIQAIWENYALQFPKIAE